MVGHDVFHLSNISSFILYYAIQSRVIFTTSELKMRLMPYAGERKSYSTRTKVIALCTL